MDCKIGVFDSGLGGRYVTRRIKARLPQAQVILKTDRKHLPYGSKTPTQLISYLRPIVADFEAQGTAAIVIACNTATTNVWYELKALTHLPIFGVEPALELAEGLSQSRVAVVCATDATLASKRYQQLKNEWSADLKLIEPNCSRWASLIEAGRFGEKQLHGLIKVAQTHQADIIVLGCSHYFWFAERLRQLDSSLSVIEPTEVVIDKLLAVVGHES